MTEEDKYNILWCLKLGGDTIVVSEDIYDRILKTSIPDYLNVVVHSWLEPGTVIMMKKNEEPEYDKVTLECDYGIVYNPHNVMVEVCT